MSTYRPLLDLQVMHGFYAGGQCRGLVFQPSAGTVRQLERTGCVWKASGSGFVLHAEQGRIGRFFDEGSESFTLGFIACSQDVAFATATEGWGRPAGARFLFSRTLAEDTQPACWDASAADIKPLNSPHWAGLLPGRAPASLAFGLQLVLPDASPRQCCIRFGARALPWAYYLVGDWPRDGLYLADADGGVQFSALAPLRLPDGREVLGARSSVSLPLAERARQHIQLRRRVNGGERVLVKRLPVAAPGVWGLLPDGGGLVAEIYVNR